MLKIQGADAQTERVLNAVEPACPAKDDPAAVIASVALEFGNKPDMDFVRLESRAKARRLAAQEVEQERARVKAAKFKKRAAEAALAPYLRKWAEADSRYDAAETLLAAKIQQNKITDALRAQLGILEGSGTNQRWATKGKRWGVLLDVPHGEGVLHLAAWGDVSETGLLETVNIGAAPVGAPNVDGDALTVVDGDARLLVSGIFTRPLATLRQIQDHFSREVSWELDLRNGRADMGALDAFMAALRLIASWGKALEQAMTPTDAYLIQEGRIRLLEMQGQDTSHMIQRDRFVSRGEPARPLLDDKETP